MAWLTILAAAWMAAEETAKNLLPNPGFEQGLEGWTTRGLAEFAGDQEVKHSGQQSVRLTVAAGEALQYQQIFCTLPAEAGEVYRATFWVRSTELPDGAGAYGALEFLQGDRRVDIAHSPMADQSRPSEWQPLTVEGTVPEEATSLRLLLVLHAHGTAWFDDAEVVRVHEAPPPQPLPVTLTLRPEEVITDRWQGFGAQGDLFLHLQRTLQEGITDEDRQLVRRRILALRPQMVRLIFNLTDWEAERGQRTPDSEGMKDLRETLAVYQAAGADVQLTEWGYRLPDWCRATQRAPHPDERRAFTDSWAAAVKYLREECGFTHVRYVTLYNEPNWGGIAWEDYAAVYRSLDESLKAARLREEVALLGPDEANQHVWLPQAIAELDDVIDYYDVHNYTGNTGPEFGAWIRPRVAELPPFPAPGLAPPRKRLLVCEFGMGAGMSTYATPHNHKYEYGLFLADAAITAANEGVSAMLMWCLMDTNYGQRMKWGLWRFKDEQWEPRPGFYAWSLLTRYTERGSTVHRLSCDVLNAAAVAFRAPHDGPWTLLAVNRSRDPRPLTLAGLPAGSRWRPFVYSEEAVPTPDREMIPPGEAQEAGPDGRLPGTLPPRSFVLWRQEEGE